MSRKKPCTASHRESPARPIHEEHGHRFRECSHCAKNSNIRGPSLQRNRFTALHVGGHLGPIFVEMQVRGINERDGFGVALFDARVAAQLSIAFGGDARGPRRTEIPECAVRDADRN